MSNLLKALHFTLKHEGGYVNDPDDPGGETNYGISKRAHPNEDIRNLKMDRVTKIYENDYWIPAGCEALPLCEAVAVFDTAVNCGVSRAKRWLRESKDLKEFLEKRRMHYYQLADDNPKFHKYIRGWINRLNDLKKYLDILTIEEHLP